MRLVVFSILFCLISCGSYRIARNVDVDDYYNIEKCWSSGGQFQSFVVVHEDDGRNFPYFISAWCGISEPGYPSGMGFLSHIKAIRFIEDEGIFKKGGYFHSKFQSTSPDHTPLPGLKDNIYAFCGKVVNSETRSGVLYRVVSIKYFKSQSIKLESFVKLTQKKRLVLFESNGC